MSSDRPRKTLLEMRQEAIDAESGTGWKCRSCGCQNFRVKSTWRTKNGDWKRSRVCRNCGDPLDTTHELMVPEGFVAVVVPKNS